MKVLLVITAMLLEFGLLVELGNAFGTLTVLAWILLALVSGAWLVRAQARRLAVALGAGGRSKLGGLSLNGATPLQLDALRDSGLLIVAGALLAIPGLVSDAVALALLLPAVRRSLFARLTAVRDRPSRRATSRASRADVEVIPPGVLPSPFGRRPRVIDVD